MGLYAGRLVGKNLPHLVELMLETVKVVVVVVPESLLGCVLVQELRMK